jgi:hypothetical protein
VSFSAGHGAKDPFALVLVALFQLHLGVRLTPGAKAERGLFDPGRVLDAIARRGGAGRPDSDELERLGRPGGAGRGPAAALSHRAAPVALAIGGAGWNVARSYPRAQNWQA